MSKICNDLRSMISYVLTCSECISEDVGSTIRIFKARICEHLIWA